MDTELFKAAEIMTKTKTNVKTTRLSEILNSVSTSFRLQAPIMKSTVPKQINTRPRRTNIITNTQPKIWITNCSLLIVSISHCMRDH